MAADIAYISTRQSWLDPRAGQIYLIIGQNRRQARNYIAYRHESVTSGVINPGDYPVTGVQCPGRHTCKWNLEAKGSAPGGRARQLIGH